MKIFSQKWLKWLPLILLLPLTIIFDGGWTADNSHAKIITNNLVAKDAITYNHLPVTKYGKTPWSPMQLDFQQYDVFQGRTVQRIESVENNKVLYATGNNDGSNTKWYLQNISSDIEPHQILSNISGLNWNYDVKIWNNKVIYFKSMDQKYKGSFYQYNLKNQTTKLIINNVIYSDIGYKCFNDNFIYSNIISQDNISIESFNLLTEKNNLVTELNLATDKHINIQKGNLYYFDINQNIWFERSLDFFDPFFYGNPILFQPASQIIVVNSDWLIYRLGNDWYLHANFNLINDRKILVNIDKCLVKDHKLFYLKDRYCYYYDILENNKTIQFKNKTMLNINKNVHPQIKNLNQLNNNIIHYPGYYSYSQNVSYNFIQRWIKPNHDFNLNVAKIAAYGNANKQAMIDFTFNPNWQNKDYYLNNTNYYLHYWIDNKEKVISVPLQKSGDHYRFALSNDDLINYAGKTLHVTLLANVNGREVNNIKLAQANGLFKYDDVNDTYDYSVRNYTPPYWTKARIVGLAVGCVLAVPLLVAIFFWLKRQWHKIYF